MYLSNKFKMLLEMLKIPLYVEEKKPFERKGSHFESYNKITKKSQWNLAMSIICSMHLLLRF